MEARAMSRPTLDAQSARLLLRLRLALLRANPLTLAAALLLLAVAGSFAWTAHAVGRLEAARTARIAQAAAASASTEAPVAASPVAPVVAAAEAPDNLARFYAALGQRRDAEQQVKTLFALAASNGLSLSQGEYKSGYDRNAHVYTYQVNLPVKGSYAAIWQFALGALRAIPFASLDDIGFRRDDIKDAQVEARLRLTLYLSDRLDDRSAGRADGGAGGLP
jgi:hypothetical protein